MSSLHKLQICGIRSFSPNHEHSQTIEFHHPLTIILGRNGAGKTTIIESCLNACTGELPSGGSDKCSFVHDPRVAGEADVRAQIRFTFRATSGRDMQVTRTYQANVARSKTTFHTVDASLAVRDPTTNKVTSGTFRCQDIDRMIPELLGVSRAVLENVVFCHQEEGNWPLGTSTDVKKRLDDIFASTKYVAALDKFRDCAKMYRTKAKEQEATLIQLKEHCTSAQNLRDELNQKESETAKQGKYISDCETRVARLSKVVAALEKVMGTAQKLQQDQDQTKGVLEEKLRVMNELKIRRRGAAIKPASEVKRALEKHDEFVRNAAREKADKEHILQKLQTDKERLSADIHANDNALTNYRDSQKVHQRRVADVQALIARIAGQFQIELTGLVGHQNIDDQGILRFLDEFERRVQELRSKRDETRKANEDKIRKAEKDREVVVNRTTTLQAELQQKQQRVKEAKVEMTSLKAAYDADPTFAFLNQTTVEQVMQDTNRVKQTIEDRKAKLLKSNVRQKLQQTLSHIDQANRKAKALRTELDERNQERDLAARLGLMRQSRKEKQDVLDEILKKKIWPQLKQLVGRSTEVAQLQKEMDALKVSKDTAKKNAEKASLEAEKRVAIITSAIEERKKVLQQKESYIDSQTSVLAAKLAVETDAIIHFQKARDDMEQSITASIQSIAHHETQIKITEEVMKTSKSDSRCDTCKRQLTKAEQADFVDVQSKKLATVRDSIVREKKALAEKQAKLEIMKKVQGDVHNLNRVRDEEIPTLKKEVEVAERELQTATASVRDIRSALEVATQDVAQVHDITTQAQRVLALSAEVQQLNTNITSLEKSAGVSASKRALDIVAAEYDEVQRTLQEMNQGLVTLQGEADAEAKQVQQLDQELHDKQLEAEKTVASLRRSQDMMQRFEALKAEISLLESQMEQIQGHRKEIEGEVKAATATVEELRNKASVAEAQMQEKLDGFVREEQVLRSQTQGIKEHIQVKVDDKITSLTAVVQELRAQHQRLCEVESDARTKFHEAARYVDEQQSVKRDLEDMLAIHTVEADVNALQARIRTFEAELQAIQQQHLTGLLEGMYQPVPGDSVRSIHEKCKQQIGELNVQAAKYRGAQEQLQHQMESHRAKLTSEKYQDIEKRLTSTQIKLRTAEIAYADIDKYYKALDKAVTQYHADKMRELNTIISNLWRTTYTGSDIDSIEIKFEEDAAGQTAATARRNIKYRVVMKKGDTELDMRGRCSAGQKVLASVVIRLALSEAFCCDCGVLVLDEPTTNLDEDNVLSLARALRTIIESRRALRHFQLVVITHDEPFVRELGQKHLCDWYYYVHKTMDGRYSIIDKVEIDKLFA